MVLAAHKQLVELQRQDAKLNELQGAQLCSLLFNINRDQKKGKATTYKDWLFFRDEEREPEDQLPAVVANVCLALRHEGVLPPLLVGIWRDVVKAASPGVGLPTIRALVSEDRSAVVIAPQWEGQHLRGFLAVKGHEPSAAVAFTDLDRPLMRYCLQLPKRLQPVHYEAGVLLLQVKAAGIPRLGASSR